MLYFPNKTFAGRSTAFWFFVWAVGFLSTSACGAPVGPVGTSSSSSSEPPTTTEDVCPTEIENPYMRFHTQLMGNPSTDPVPRAKYTTAFGSACYMSDGNPSTFNCVYRTSKKACEDGVLVAEVFGAAPYDKNYPCLPVGNGDFTRQVGPDSALIIRITLAGALRQTPLFDINGTETAINGPYRNLPEPKDVAPGKDFYQNVVDKNGVTIEQRALILQVNRDAHVGEIHSDLAGFTWPCDKLDPSKMCTEATVLQVGKQYDDDAAEVHHVVRRQDERCCPWGTNSSANAVVISRKLNSYFRNKYPAANEVIWINNLPAYTP